MTTDTLLQKVVEFTTPSDCLVCSREQSILCNECRVTAIQRMPLACYLCGVQNSKGRTCCQSPLDSLAVVSRYEDVTKELIYRFKFEGDQSAGRLCARYMAELINPDEVDVVVAVTTTPARRRQRGYDQSVLLAKEIASRLSLPYTRALVRVKNIHQIGQGRDRRLEQASGLYAVTNVRTVRGRRILLVDDVVTTGATITAAAQVLQDAGATEVGGLAFARDELIRRKASVARLNRW